MKKITAEQKRNILARLQAIEENERELQKQYLDAMYTISNTENALEELREEKNAMIKKLVRNA